MRSLKGPSCLERARASVTSSASASASTRHHGSDCGGVGLSRRGAPERSGGLIPQDGSLPFDPPMRSPKPPSCFDSARASLAASNSAIVSASHFGRISGGVSLSGRRVPGRSGGLIPQDGSPPSEPSVIYPKPPYF